MRTAVIVFLMMTAACFKSQDTISLKEVDVKSTRTNLSGIGKKTESIDSLTKQQFIYNSLGEVLSLNTPVFIKNYGPGSLSSTSFRGGSASHTGIIWNGFNIQNGMLGQIDLSLIPSVLFDNINIEYGGSSSLWGSGAVGGSIHLNNKPLFSKGFTTIANISKGSYGLFNASTNIEVSNKKFISSTKAYLQNSLNNYAYKDTLDKIKPLQTQKHAAYSFKGLLQEFRFLLTQKQSLTVNGWYNIGTRQLPVFNTLNVSRAEQFDANFKTTATWNYLSNNFHSIVRGAFFNDALNYRDSAFAIDSKSNLKTFIGENENNLNWSKHNIFNFGINHTSYSGKTDNYGGLKTLQKTAIFIGNKFSFFNQRLITYVSLRGEYISNGKLPLTGSAALEYKITNAITAKVNAAKVYRQPTLNELYWKPGGNPLLLPEQGYTTEGDLSFIHKWDKISLFVSGSAYYRMINNWILWLPGINSVTPVNIQEVISRGTETTWKLQYQQNKFRINLNTVTGYVLSTILSSKQENGNTQGKQLIYTPRYSVNSSLSVSYGMASITYYHQYIGYRFTSSDNLQWLTPYHYSSIRCNLKTKLGETAIVLYAACNNVFNTNYTVIAGRFMPLRSFEIGVSIAANKPYKPKQINTNQQ